ncbi:hypothetical protein AGOR_G00023440 [Albula goreensis]|uniref:Lysozyme g n=1 Tax=Albula goreensis TaxID=1534307 RepID=A0A8T3E1F7_9TELE|nr:hypothetical protein AGOR_G00023440 [Albula goreensis]
MACIYGDVMKMDTTGASEKTAKQDNLTVQGVDASHMLAQHDLNRMNKYRDLIIRVGRAHQMDPAVISGIISRESRAGAALTDGWGDHGNAFGLMQIDKRYHNPMGEWDSEQHVSQGTQILIELINEIKRKFRDWPKEHQFKGGIAAYNFGVKNVQTYEHLDVGTTGNDYSSDVVARAQWFKQNGF